MMHNQGIDFSDSLDNITIYGNTVYIPDILIDWVPEPCRREKYIPAWHLVKSYKS